MWWWNASLSTLCTCVYPYLGMSSSCSYTSSCFHVLCELLCELKVFVFSISECKLQCFYIFVVCCVLVELVQKFKLCSTMCYALVKLKLNALNHSLCSYWIKIRVNSKFLGFLLANAIPRFLFFYKFNTCRTQIEHHFNFQPFCIFFLLKAFCFFFFPLCVWWQTHGV
jgi:hypothetical protein